MILAGPSSGRGGKTGGPKRAPRSIGGSDKPNSVPCRSRAALIPLTGPLPAGSSGPPGDPPRRSGEPVTGSRRSPYLALLRTGFAVPRPSPVERWALTPPFHPCPATPAGRCVFCGTFPRVAAAGRYPACSRLEFGLSSTPQSGAASACRLRCRPDCSSLRTACVDSPAGDSAGFHREPVLRVGKVG
jgi:hypothetical protein